MKNIRLIVCVNKRLGSGQKSCAGSGSLELIKIIKNHFADVGLAVPIVEQVCLGRCAEGITMRIAPGGPFITGVTRNDLRKIEIELRDFANRLS